MSSPLPRTDLARLDQVKLWMIGVLLAERGSRMDDPRFSETDWQFVDRCASQHRLRPLLLDRLSGSWEGWQIPDNIRQNWQARSKRAAIRALDRHAVTVEVTRTLEQAGIASAVLKGGALGVHYGNPALRPMRDIDILVAPAHAPEAFARLLAAGLIRRAEVSGTSHIDYATHKHLEALWSPRRKVAVELHTALVDQPRGAREDEALMQIDDLLARRRAIKLGSHTVPVLGWAETMLHLIVHAVYDHQLNNGPLVLSDCAVLARDPEADWEQFRQIAERSGRGAGARLVFAIIDRYAPQPPAGAFSLGLSTDPALVEQSALLMLQDTGQSDVQGGWDRLFAQGSWQRRLRLAWARARLRSRAAREPAHDHAGRGNLSLAWRMVRALADPVQRRDVRRSRAVFGWLQDKS